MKNFSFDFFIFVVKQNFVKENSKKIRMKKRVLENLGFISVMISDFKVIEFSLVNNFFFNKNQKNFKKSKKMKEKIKRSQKNAS